MIELVGTGPAATGSDNEDHGGNCDLVGADDNGDYGHQGYDSDGAGDYGYHGYELEDMYMGEDDMELEYTDKDGGEDE